jgi:Skp family chaperone for outer membrane proteins
MILGGCSRVDVHSNAVRGVGYVRIDQVIKHHPLYPQLQQLNDAIAAIELEASVPHAPLSPQEVQAQTLALNKQLADAQNRVNAIIAQKQQEYGQQERDADIAALKAAGIDPRAAGIGAAMNATSQAQAAQAAQAAQQDFQAYQQSVVRQDSAAASAVAQQLNKEAVQKFRARESEYQQEENDLSLRLAQQDATQRLALQTKLNNIAMDATQRKDVTDQLAAIDKKENDQVNAMRSRHAQELAQYQQQLRTQTEAQIRRQVGAIQSQTQAKLSAHGQELRSQLQGLGAAPVPQVSIPPDVRSKLQQIHDDMAKKFQTDAQAAVAEYQATKSDLDAQFAALHGENVGATGAAAKQLRDLQQRHDQLQAQIQAQIQREADKVAKDMGFNVVFDNATASGGAYDLTNDLIRDVESLHE